MLQTQDDQGAGTVEAMMYQCAQGTYYVEIAPAFVTGGATYSTTTFDICVTPYFHFCLGTGYGWLCSW